MFFTSIFYENICFPDCLRLFGNTSIFDILSLYQTKGGARTPGVEINFFINLLNLNVMSIPVMRYKRNKMLGDATSPELYYLKRTPGYTRTYTIDDVAAETEAIGALSAEDVSHVMKSFVRSLRKVLVKGDKVKIEGLGTFYITFNCLGTEEEKDCTVRNIHRVNIRFATDNALRLVNDSTASTRGGANNVEFYIKSDDLATSGTSGNGSSGSSGSGSGSGNGNDGSIDE